MSNVLVAAANIALCVLVFLAAIAALFVLSFVIWLAMGLVLKSGGKI